MKKTLHFTVDANFLTGHARDLWSEGEYHKAIDFLGTLNGMTLDQMHDLINGKVKFEEDGHTQTFRLVADNWMPNVNACHLCQYPNPEHGNEMNTSEEKLKEWEARKRFSKLLYEMQESVRDEDVRYFLSPKTPKPEDILSDDIKNFMEAEKFNAQLEESETRPEPETDVFPNGIITPDGSFYRCEFAGHALLAKKMGYDGRDDLEPDSVAVIEGCAVVSVNLLVQKIRVLPDKKTKEQAETIRRWYAAGWSGKVKFVTLDY